MPRLRGSEHFKMSSISVPAIPADYKCAKGEFWTVTDTGTALVVSMPDGSPVASVGFSDAETRISVPSFGGHEKCVTVVADNGKTVRFKSKKELVRVVRRFALLGELHSGTASPSQKTMYGVSLMSLSAAIPVVAFMMIQMAVSQGAGQSQGVTRLIVWSIIGMAVAFSMGLKLVLNAKRMKKILAEMTTSLERPAAAAREQGGPDLRPVDEFRPILPKATADQPLDRAA